MKELILKGIFESMHVLESFTFLGVPDKVLSSVARRVTIVERRKVWVDWLDEVIGNICLRRDRIVLPKKEEQLKTRLAELLGETAGVQQMLGEIQTEISAKGLPSGSSDSDQICIL